MSIYFINFLISLVLSLFLGIAYLVYSRKHVWYAILIPVVFFLLFYNYDYSLLQGCVPLIICYVGAFYSCFLICFFASAQRVLGNLPKRNILIAKIIISFLFQIACIFICLSYPWAIDTFPLSNVDAVLFTLFAGVKEGAEEFVLSSFLKRVPLYAGIVFLISLMIQLSFSFYLKKEKCSFQFHLWRWKYCICFGRFKEILFQVIKLSNVFFFIYTSILSLLLPGIFLSSSFKALTEFSVNSELYEKYYVNPDSVKISPPDSMMNLIIIFMESMETNFAKYTPEISSLQQNSTFFAPGGENCAGTSWTIAGITGKLCGIPLNMPMGIDEYLGRLPTYLPGAKCLPDILRKYDYNQSFVQGSKGEFTQIRNFTKKHGNINIHDLRYFKEIKKIPDDYMVFWGIEDRKIYRYVMEELDSLSKKNSPFALYMSTIDTHQPEGYLDSDCMNEFEYIKEKYPKVLRCASKQLNDFVDWVRKQPWYDNTVISVMGDHTMPMLSSKAHVPLDDTLYWTNFVINSAMPKNVRNRKYTSLDMFPTILESMNFKIEGRRLGLGRSLYSDSLTVLEIYGRMSLDKLLRERSFQYDNFLFEK